MTGGTVPLDHVAALVARWRKARCEAKRLRGVAAAAEAELAAALGDADVGTLNGIPAVRRTTENRPRFDATRFRGAHPDLFDEFSYPHQRDELIIPRQSGPAESVEGVTP